MPRGVPEARRGFEVDRDLGAAMLRLLRKGDDWVHRRVETILLEDSVTFTRHVSVDFTLPRDLPAAAFTGAGEPIHFLPLTLLAKGPLVDFSVTDETGRSLPVLTRARNTMLAASVLVFLAEASLPVEFAQEHGGLPPDVEAELVVVAGSGDDARKAAERVLAGAAPPTDADDRDRSAEWRNRLATQPEFRRVVRQLADSFILTVPLVGLPGIRRVVKFDYEEHGRASELSIPSPLGAIARRWIRDVSGPAKAGSATFGVPRRYTPLPLWISRALGWRPKAIKIHVPALTHGGSYHLEVAAPEGLQITRASLASRAPDTLLDDVRESRQRVHLYPRRVPPSLSSGVALINLRPEAPVIVRTAWLTAALTTLLLMLVAARWRALVSELDATVSLLLVVPALVGGFVGRPRDTAVANEVLFGLRCVAVLPALWLFAAGLVLLLGRSCVPVSGAGNACSSWSATSPVLWGLTMCSAITLFVLTTTLTLILRPAEQRVVAPEPGREA